MEVQQQTVVKKSSATKTILIVIGSVFLIWFLFGGGLDQQAATSMTNIQDKVAADAVDQYHIAEKGGDAIQICVQAGLVAAAYLQAKDEPHYLQWQQVKKADCTKAGMPQ